MSNEDEENWLFGIALVLAVVIVVLKIVFGFGG